MTSGTFQSIAIGDIIVNRQDRQRRELPNLDVLADSVKRLGLIHPIVITRDFELIAGERRLEAVRSLGHTHINCQFFDELDSVLARAIELEENIKREALPWQDECRAVAEYHALRLSEEIEWTQVSTATALGMSPSQIAEKLQVAREIDSGNAMVALAPHFSTARGIVRRAESRKDEAALLAFSPAAVALASAADSITCADFNEWAPTYSGPKFNFIHCDFPYGINAQSFGSQGGNHTHGAYADDENTYWKLCQSLVTHLDRVAGESCHFMFWYSMHYHADTMDFFARNSDIRFDPFPLVWVKSDNVGMLPDPTRGPRRIYETCLFGSRGDRQIVRPTSNAISHPSQRDTHMSVKPEGMLAHFFRMFVDANTLMLDPTCGSGGALRAAEALGAKHVIGLEANPEFAERANLALRKSRSERKVSEHGTTQDTAEA